MKIIYRCDNCKEEFTLTKLVQKQIDEGKPIHCPNCDSNDIYDTGYKVKNNVRRYDVL